MNEDVLKIGLITSPHGVRGEINILPLTDDPSRFRKAKNIIILDNAGNVESSAKMISANVSGRKVFAKIEGIDTPESAQKFRSKYIAVKRTDAVRLPDNTFFICDIIGCKVFLEDGAMIGIIKDVIETGASDVYSVERTGMKDLLIPAVKEFIRNVDIAEGRIVVRLPEGLEDI